MAFWSGDKLESDGQKLVSDFDPSRIDCSSYTLTLGPECFVTPQFGEAGPKLKQQLEVKKPAKFGSSFFPMSGGEMVIPAGQFAFLLTEEFISIPPEAMGFISLKSTAKWKGLINVSGFHVDPGFTGRLVYSVYNAGPSNIHLSRGEPLFLLWVADLDQKSSEKYRKDGKTVLTEISSKLISDIDRPLHSLQSLSETVDTLQRELTLLYRVLTALGVIFGLVFAAWALLPARNFTSDGDSRPDTIQ